MGRASTRNYSSKTLLLWRRESIFVLIGTAFLVLSGVTALLTHPRYPDVGPSVILIAVLFAGAIVCLILVLSFMVRTLLSARKDRRTAARSVRLGQRDS